MLVEVRAILCLVAAVVTEGQAPVEDMEAPVEMAMEAQVLEDSQVEEEMEDMELPVEDLAVKSPCSSALLSVSRSVRMSHASNVKL